MAIKYTKQYGNLSEALYDTAKNTPLFDVAGYEKAVKEGVGDEYAAVLIDASSRTSTSFDKSKYDMLDADTRYAYLMNEFYGDKDSEEYKKNAAYFNDVYVKSVNKEQYEAMNWLQKAGKTMGGLFSNAWAATLGLTEGLIDAALYLGSGGGLIEGSRELISKDITGYAELQEKLSLDYSGIDSNAVVKAINDITTGIVRMSPMIIGYALVPLTGGVSATIGNTMYYGSMLGGVAEEAIKASPDIGFWNLLGYTAGSVALEAGIESLSGKIGGSLFGGKGAGVPWWKQIGIDFASEAAEEMVSELTGSLLYQWTVDPNAPVASIKDILYAGLIGGLTGAILSGGKVLTTSRFTVDSQGNLIQMKDARKAGLKIDKSKVLSKGKSYNAMAQMRALNENIDKSSVIKLQEKYSDLSLNDIKIQHAEEYQKAFDKDTKTNQTYIKTINEMAAVLKTIGETNFTKAVDILNYSYEKAATLMDNFKNNVNAYSVEAKAAQLLFSEKNPGMNIAISEDLTKVERRLRDWLKSELNIDTFFGTVGSENGVDPGQIVTTGNNIFIQKGIFDTMSMDQVMETVVKRKIVDNVMQDISKIRPTLYAEAMQIVNETDTTEYNNLTEEQKRTLTQMLLYDPITIGKTFQRNKNVFQRMFDTISKWITKNRETKKKNNATKLEFAALVKARNEYVNQAAQEIGNFEDAETFKQKFHMSDDMFETMLKNKFLPSILNEYYVLAEIDNHQDAVNKKRLIKELLLNRVETDLTAPIDWTNITNESYFVTTFIDAVKKEYPDLEWEDAIWEYIYDNYNLVWSAPNNTVYSKIDMVEYLKGEVRSELNDAIIANSIEELTQYTNINQLFTRDFLRRFDKPNVTITWNRTSGVSTTARTVKTAKGLKIEVYAGQKLDLLQTALMHEVAHVMALQKGMPFGTSADTMAATLRQNVPESMVRGLAFKLLTEDTRDWSLDQIIDELAFQMYIMSKGEVYARGDVKEYAMFKDGFVVDDEKVMGIGKFEKILGLPFEFPLAKTTRKEAAFDAVDNAGGDLARWLVEKGFSDPAKAGFSEQAIELIGNAHKGDLWQLFLSPPEMSDVKTNKPKPGHINGVGTEQANNLLIAFLKPENKYITTIKKAITAQKYYELSVPFIAISKKFNKNHKANQPYSMTLVRDKVFSDKYLNEIVTDTFFKKGKEVTVSQLLETTTNTLDSYAHNHPANTGVLIELIDLDFDFSENKTKELFKDLEQGLDSSKDSLFVTGVVKSESGELTEQADLNEDETIETPDTYVENLGTEEDTLAGLTMEDIQQMSVEDLRKTVNDWVTNVGTNTPQGFSVADRIDKPMAKNRLKKLIGEDKYNTLQNEIGVLRKSNIEDRIKTAKKRLARVSALTNTEQTLLETDTSEYKTPMEFLYYEEMMNIASKRALVKAVNAQKRKLNNMGDLTKEQQKLLDTDTREFSLIKYENLLKKLTVETAKTSKQVKEVTKKATEAAKVKEEKIKDKVVKTLQKALNIDSDEKIDIVIAKEQELKPENINITPQIRVKVEKLKSLFPPDMIEKSEYQGDFNDPKRVAADSKIIKNNNDFFESLTSNDVQQMITALAIQVDDDFAAAADVLLRRYAYDNRYVQFNDISEWIKKVNKVSKSKSGSELAHGRWSYGKGPVFSLITEVSIEHNQEIILPENIVDTAITAVTGEKLTKEKFLENVQNELNALIEQQANTTDPYDKFVLKEKIKEKTKLLDALADGDNTEILDNLVDILDTSETNQTENQEKITDLYSMIIDYVLTHTEIDNNNQPLFKKHKTLLAPNQQRKLTRILLGINSFRYLAMLSSPITAGKNALSNTAVATQALLEDTLLKRFENTQWLSADSQVRFTGNYDAEFSKFVEDKYLAEIKKQTAGDKYTTSELDRLKNQYAKENDPLNKSKLLKKIKQFEEKMLNDQPWTQRRALRNLKNMLSGAQPQIYNQCYDTLRAMYAPKNQQITSDELYDKIKTSNEALAELFNSATKGKLIDVIKLGEQLNVPLLSLDKNETNSIFNMAMYRANKLFFKINNKLNTAINSLKNSNQLGAKVVGYAITMNMPFVRTLVNTTGYIIQRSPLGLAQGIFSMLQTKSTYWYDMVTGVERYYKDVYIKTKSKELGKKFKFTQEEFTAWAKTNVPADTLSALQNKRQYKQLQQIYDNMVNEGKIPPHAIGADNVFMRATALEQLAQGAVGTSIMALGLILGCVLDAFEYDDDDEYLGPVIRLGDLKIALNDLSPFSTLFAMGAMLTSGKIDNNLLAAWDVFVDSTILSTMDSSLRYSNNFKDFILNQITNTVTQMQPALTKRTAKLIYNTKKDKTGDFGVKLLKTLASNSIIFNWLVPDKINPYTGAPMTYYDSGIVERIFGFALPINFRVDVKSDLQREAERLNVKTSGVSGTYKINDKEYTLTAEEKTEASKYRANYIQEQFDLISSGKQKVTVKMDDGSYKTTYYNNLTDEQKANVLENLYSTASTNAKIMSWISRGNVYRTGSKEEYDRLRKLFESQKIQYKKGYKKSKFVEV